MIANGHGEATDTVYESRRRVDLREEIMALHVEAKAGGRLATHSKNNCPQCSASLLAPSWSEHFSERCVRHIWSCEACGYEFETAVFFPALEQAAA
jgi:ribosomal protein L37AE/L43A